MSVTVRFERDDATDTVQMFEVMVLPGLERIGTALDGFFTLTGIEDDGTRVYRWAAPSALAWVIERRDGAGGGPMSAPL